MKKKKLLLISLDALSCTDFAYIQTLPNFQRLIAEGAYCPNETSVYPSLTFPCHASIATGCVPDSHGIVNNYILNPFSKLPKWNFYASNLKRKAIWDYAAENGKRVLNMSWPVSAGAPRLTHARDVARQAKGMEYGQLPPPDRCVFPGTERPALP